MKERKIIFAYAKREGGKYCYVSAVSEDESKKFHFTVDWNNYEQSIKEMLSVFEKFCVEECGFYDSAYCDVWFSSRSVGEELDGFLGSVDWCCVNYLELNFNWFSTHTNYKNFEAFKKEQGYDEQKEPYATKKLYSAYKKLIDKKEFSKTEQERMKQYFYRKCPLIDSARRYNYDSAAHITMARFFDIDKTTFYELMDYAYKIYQEKTLPSSCMYDFCESILEEYHELYDYDDWIYCSRHGNDDKPLLEKKYADLLFSDSRLDKIREIIEEQERKYDEARMQMRLALQRAIKS